MAIELTEWKNFHSVKIPVRFAVTWEDKGSPWSYWMVGGVEYNINITWITTGQEPCLVEIDFSPVLDLASGGSAAGRRWIRVTGVSITGGSYSALREGNSVAIEIDVTGQWKPSGLPLITFIFTQEVRSFRTRPTTYKWHGVVELSAERIMPGAWERK